MKKIAFIILGCALTLNSFGQSLDNLLKTVEKNNVTLAAFRKATDAAKAANHAEVALDDLEVGYNRLWGSPTDIGNRNDVSVSQSFDLPTVFGAKGKVAKHKDILAENDYLIKRQDILLETKLCYIDAVYYNALVGELQKRCQDAKEMMKMQKKMLDAGEINIIEYNNLKLTLATASTALTQAKAEKEAVNAQLTQLNGGLPVTITDTIFTPITLGENFEEWFGGVAENAPTVAMARNGIALGKSQLSLARQSWLPKISMGYMSEKTVGEHFQGVTLGMSVPLWSAGKKVKTAKAEASAAEANHTAALEELRKMLASEYALTKGLMKAAKESSETLRTTNNNELLKKACQTGEMSTLDYLISLTAYYDAVEQALQAEREAQKAHARLTAITL